MERAVEEKEARDVVQSVSLPRRPKTTGLLYKDVLDT